MFYISIDVDAKKAFLTEARSSAVTVIQYDRFDPNSDNYVTFWGIRKGKDEQDADLEMPLTRIPVANVSLINYTNDLLGTIDILKTYK